MIGIHRIRPKNKDGKLRKRGSTVPKAKSTKPAAPTGIAADAIKIKIRELRALERQAFAARHGKTDFYVYLKAIYKARDWTDSAGSRRSANDVAAVCQVGTRKNKSPIRTLIDATSIQKRDVKSKWVQALEYAKEKAVPAKHFKTFLKENGGIDGCAKKMAALRKARRQKRSQSKAP
jgi:hypothetical protein